MLMCKTPETCVSFGGKMNHLVRRTGNAKVHLVDPKEFQDIKKLVTARVAPKIMPSNYFKYSAQLELPLEMFKLILEKDNKSQEQDVAKMVHTKLQKPVTRTQPNVTNVYVVHM